VPLKKQKPKRPSPEHDLALKTAIHSSAVPLKPKMQKPKRPTAVQDLASKTAKCRSPNAVLALCSGVTC